MSALAATAVTPGNVTIPGAMISGKSSLSPFRYEQQNDHVVVFAVPIVDEHVDDTSPKPFDKLTGDLFEEVFNSTKGYEDRGAYAAVIIGHTTGDEKDTYREVVGHIRNFKMTGKAPNRQIVGDFFFATAFFDAAILTNLYPRRSSEISSVDWRIDPVALLGATSPARPLPDMIFAKGQERQVYMSTHATTTFSKESAMDPEIKTMFEKFDARMSTFEQGMAKFQASLAKFQDVKDEPDDDEDKAKAKAQADDDDDKEKLDHEDDDEGKDKDKAKKQAAGSKQHFAQVTAKVEALETSIGHLKAANDRLQLEKVESEVVSTVRYMKSQGVQIGDEDAEKKLTATLCKLSTEDRKARYAEMERYYQRVPVNASIARSGLETEWTRTGEPEDQTSFEEDATEKAVKYQKDHPGVSLQQAHDAVRGVAV